MVKKSKYIKTIVKEKHIYTQEQILELIRQDLQKNKNIEVPLISECKVKMYALTNNSEEIPVYIDKDFDYYGVLVTVEYEINNFTPMV